MKHLQAFDRYLSRDRLDDPRFVEHLLWAEAMYCRVHGLSLTRHDGFVEALAAAIAARIDASTVSAKA